LLSGAALVGLAFTSVPAIAYAFMTLDGAGAVILDVLAITMLQRTVSSDVMARVSGILMSLSIAGTLLGSMIAPLVLELFGLRIAVLAAGALLPVVALIVAPRLRALNRRAELSTAALAPRVRLLSGLAVLKGAAPGAIEGLAAAAREQEVRAGTTVISEGEPADHLYVVAAGGLDVTSSGEERGPARRVNTLVEGDYFGEIGLLERMPRTASVTATSDCTLLEIDGGAFLDAVNRAPSLAAAFRSGAIGRLARTHPSYRLAASETAT
jgi:hypothetical protein